MRCFIAAVALLGLGILVYFTIMFMGPHMRVQQHIRAYQRTMPLPPEGIVPVEPDRYAIPSAGQVAGAKNQVPDNQASRDRGKTYYTYYCVFCHGENGQGDGPVGYSYMPTPTDLHDKKVTKLSDGDLMKRMLTGIGHDPVLPRVVAPEHRWYLITYIRALAKTERTPAENQGRQVILRGPERR